MAGGRSSASSPSASIGRAATTPTNPSTPSCAAAPGREVAETLADAFVTGIHAGDPTLLSVRAAFPRLAAMEREHGSVLRGFAAARRKRRGRLMWSFREGLGLLIETLRERLRTPPVSGVAVRSVRRSPEGGWEVRADGRDAWKADAVALTCPAYQQAALLADEDAELAAKIDGIAYSRVAVVALGYRAADMPMSLDGFGYLSPQRERRDVLGVQWCSSIFLDRAPSGMVLLRALCGGWNRPEIVDWDDDRLLSAVRAELAAAMGVRAAPVFHHDRPLGPGDSAVSPRPPGARGVDRGAGGAASGAVPRRQRLPRRGARTIAWNRRASWRSGWRSCRWQGVESFDGTGESTENWLRSAPSPE